MYSSPSSAIRRRHSRVQLHDYEMKHRLSWEYPGLRGKNVAERVAADAL